MVASVELLHELFDRTDDFFCFIGSIKMKIVCFGGLNCVSVIVIGDFMDFKLLYHFCLLSFLFTQNEL